MGYSVSPTPTNAATLKNSALVTLTLRTSPEDWRTNSFGVVLCWAADGVGAAGPGPPTVSATVSLSSALFSARRRAWWGGELSSRAATYHRAGQNSRADI